MKWSFGVIEKIEGIVILDRDRRAIQFVYAGNKLNHEMRAE